MNDTSSGMLHGREVLPTMKTGWAMRLLSLQRDTLFYLHFYSLMVQKGRYATVHAPLSSPVYFSFLHVMLTNWLTDPFRYFYDHRTCYERMDVPAELQFSDPPHINNPSVLWGTPGDLTSNDPVKTPRPDPPSSLNISSPNDVCPHR